MAATTRPARQWGDSPRAMARTLAALYLAGAAIGAMTLLLPHAEASDTTMLWTNVVIAFGAAIAIGALAGRLPPWSLQVAIALGTLVVTRAVYLSHDAGTFYSLWYVWVGLYTFFFFGSRWGMVHLGLVGLTYGWALTQVPSASPIARWVMTIGTIVIAGFLIDVLTRRVRRRASESDAQAKALSAVSAVAHELARRTSPEAAALAVCESAVDVAEAERAVLWEPSSSGNSLIAIASTDPTLIGTRIAFVGRPSGAVRAFTAVQPCFVTEASSVLRRGSRASAAEGSALFQPVSQEGVPIGVLGVYWPLRQTEPDEDLRRVIDLLSVEAGIALDRAATLARLERVARTDDLTGLANRRSWDEHLHREVARARREGTALSVALLDLDHFKLYNDRLGHQAGDRLLKEAAATWATLIRETDILARYGGEEFALALPGADQYEALETLERLRVATPRGERVSAGVASWDESQSEVELLEEADRALYAAKGAGRDRVVFAAGRASDLPDQTS